MLRTRIRVVSATPPDAPAVRARVQAFLAVASSTKRRAGNVSKPAMRDENDPRAAAADERLCERVVAA
eukprot:13976531-Alexandrium_andersonii.AAC.1